MLSAILGEYFKDTLCKNITPDHRGLSIPWERMICCCISHYCNKQKSALLVGQSVTRFFPWPSPLWSIRFLCFLTSGHGHKNCLKGTSVDFQRKAKLNLFWSSWSLKLLLKGLFMYSLYSHCGHSQFHCVCVGGDFVFEFLIYLYVYLNCSCMKFSPFRSNMNLFFNIFIWISLLRLFWDFFVDSAEMCYLRQFDLKHKASWNINVCPTSLSNFCFEEHSWWPLIGLFYNTIFYFSDTLFLPPHPIMTSMDWH